MRTRALGLVLALLAGCSTGGTVSTLDRAADTPVTIEDLDTTTPTVASPTSDVTTTSEAVAGSTEARPQAAAGPERAAAWTVEPYHGFGAWLDAFDWSLSFSRSPEHVVGLEAVDHMAAEGVETIYIQGTRWNSETVVIEPERLEAIIDRAHAHGMSVVAWYLPTLVDPEADLHRMLALAELDIDGLGVDIESREVADVAERNRRLLDISARLDEALGDRVLSAIVMEPVVMEDVNPNYWPGYPWAELARHYDVWQPMSYWTNRRGPWRSAHTYTATNIARLRERIGQPDALVHTIGGIGNKTTVADLHGMVAGAVEQGAIGGSIYDYRTTQAPFWEVLRSFRRQPG